MLSSTESLVFIGERRGESKNGTPYQFIKLANPRTFENYELFASGVSVSNLSKGSEVIIEVDLNSDFGRTGLVITDINKSG